MTAKSKVLIVGNKNLAKFKLTLFPDILMIYYVTNNSPEFGFFVIIDPTLMCNEMNRENDMEIRVETFQFSGSEVNIVTFVNIPMIS